MTKAELVLTKQMLIKLGRHQPGHIALTNLF